MASLSSSCQGGAEGCTTVGSEYMRSLTRERLELAVHGESLAVRVKERIFNQSGRPVNSDAPFYPV